MANVSKPTNNLTSNLMVHSKQPVPSVGLGATEAGYSDRHAGTITEVKLFKSGSRKGQVSSVLWCQDTATRSDKNGMSDSQHYTYMRNPAATAVEFKVDKAGKFKRRGSVLIIGIRDEFYDYSF